MKFSIVTPAYNMEKWITDSIESVIQQEGEFEIEYIIVDDGSTDATGKIAKEYEKKICENNYPVRCKGITLKYISQKNTGMYQAINNGFSVATGDFFGWINADDLYEDGAFERIRLAIKSHPAIDWIKGITSTIEEDGSKSRQGICKIYNQRWLQLGIYGQESYFVEQDSVFWSKSLWKKVGGIPAYYRSAGDYWLWLEFSKHSNLWSLNIPISCFRKRSGQISKGVVQYKREQTLCRPVKSLTGWRVRLFFSPRAHIIKRLPKMENVFLFIYPILFPFVSKAYYLEVENHVVVKKPTRQYAIV